VENPRKNAGKSLEIHEKSVKIDGKSIEVLHRSPSKMMDNGDLS
jgi:hypothetical protein